MEKDLLIIKSNQLSIFRKNRTHLTRKVKKTFGSYNLELRDNLAKKMKKMSKTNYVYKHERVRAISELQREAAVSIFHQRHQSAASTALITSDGIHSRRPTLDRP